MSKIQRLVLEIENLTDDEQIELWINLFKFAQDKLPANKNLRIGVITYATKTTNTQP